MQRKEKEERRLVKTKARDSPVSNRRACTVAQRRRSEGYKKQNPGEEPAEKKAEREKSKVKLTELQKELAALKKRVSEEEEKAGVKKPPKKKKRDGASPAKPAPKPFEAGLGTKRKGKPDGHPSESPGDSDDDEDESEDRESGRARERQS